MLQATIIDVLREHATRRGEQTSFVFLPDGDREQGRIDFRQLERRSAAVARELEQRGLRGARVVLMFSSALEFVVAFFGCLGAGAIAVAVCPPRRAEGCEHALQISRAAGAQLILMDAPTEGHLSRMGEAWRSKLPEEVLSWLADPHQIAERAEGTTPRGPAAEDVAFLQFTSGSTGNPKGVVVTHANILANQRAIQRGFRHGDNTVVVSWLPFHHDMGLVGMVMQPVYLGRPCIWMPPEAFIQRPLRWLKALSRYHGTTSGGPAFGYRRCLDAIDEAALEGCADLDLRAWNIAFAGAEPVSAEALEAFAKRFARAGFDSRAFYPCYGLAEATLMVTGAEANHALRTERLDAKALGEGRATDAAEGPVVRLVSCGLPWGDDEIVIVDPDSGLPLPDNTVGEIWVSGPSVARGYWNHAEETRARFGATSPEHPGKRFLCTGDLGFVREHELFITGRLKDLLILNGRNYYPQDIESTVQTLHPAFRPQAVVFADDDLEQTRIVLVQEVHPHRANQVDLNATTELIRRKVGAAHEIRLSEIFFTTSRLPITTSGKIRRRACRDAWRAGLLKPVNGLGATHESTG